MARSSRALQPRTWRPLSPASSSLLLLVLIAAFAPNAHASVFSGFTIGRQFEYIGQFCFSWTPTLEDVAGHISGEIQTDVSDLQLAIYDDEARFWDFIMTDDTCDCRCKVSYEHTKFVYNISATTNASKPFTFSLDVHEHLRPRFWYVALARCVPGGDTYEPAFTQITEENFRKYYFTSWYNIHMTQANGAELPVQQTALPAIYATMTLLSGVAAVTQTLAARGLRQSESFHPIVKLLTLIIVCFCGANALLFTHFVVFTFTGVGAPLLAYLAQVLQVLVRVATILLAMLVAKGWTINSVALDSQEQLSCLMLTLLGLYLSMAMWYFIWLDPASTLYMYDSWPGAGICVLLLGALGWFVVTILDTRAREEASTKRRFFLHIGALFAGYIVALPVIVLIASFLSPWVREEIVAAVTAAVELAIYCALIYLLWPSRAPRYFERLYSISSPSEKASLRETNLPTEEL